MYGALNQNSENELPLIKTHCWLCGLNVEIRKGLPAYCSACLMENPKELEQYRKYLKGTPIADLFFE